MSDATKTTIRVNAKQFVEDLRAGLSDEELMLTYGLDPGTLDKLFRKLVAKNIISEEELDRETQPTMGRAFIPPSEPGEEPHDPDMPGVPPEPAEEPQQPVLKDPTKCPNCRADVGKKALICPECGHVLPGAQRWEEVEGKKPLLERIPPLVLGIIIALPFAVVAFYFLIHLLLPATEADVDKKIARLQKKRATRAAQQNAVSSQESAALQSLMDELSDKRIFVSYSAGLREMQTGPGWEKLNNKTRSLHLSRLSQSMQEAGYNPDFVVIDEEGYTVARVVGTSVEVFEADFETVFKKQEPEKPPLHVMPKPGVPPEMPRGMAPVHPKRPGLPRPSPRPDVRPE